jgi:hypothetical protein
MRLLPVTLAVLLPLLAVVLSRAYFTPSRQIVVPKPAGEQ